MNKIISWLGDLITKNTKDPFKSPAHFMRSGAASVIMMVAASLVLVPIFHYFGRATNYHLVDELITLVVAIVALYISKLFIKE